jgi:Tfp pilus assembly protein PilF
MRLAVAVAMASLISGAAAETADPHFQEEVAQGIEAYRNTCYADAVKHFTEAVRLDPTSEKAHLYLATSYMIQWAPHAESPQNTDNYRMAKFEYHQVLNIDPSARSPWQL